MATRLSTLAWMECHALQKITHSKWCAIGKAEEGQLAAEPPSREFQEQANRRATSKNGASTALDVRLADMMASRIGMFLRIRLNHPRLA